MKTLVLRGSKEEIAEKVAKLDDKVVEAIIIMEEAEGAIEYPTVEDFFREMEPYTVHVREFDDSREAIYTRMEGE